MEGRLFAQLADCIVVEVDVVEGQVVEWLGPFRHELDFQVVILVNRRLGNRDLFLGQWALRLLLRAVRPGQRLSFDRLLLLLLDGEVIRVAVLPPQRDAACGLWRREHAGVGLWLRSWRLRRRHAEPHRQILLVRPQRRHSM